MSFRVDPESRNGQLRKGHHLFQKSDQETKSQWQFGLFAAQYILIRNRHSGLVAGRLRSVELGAPQTESFQMLRWTAQMHSANTALVFV